MQDKRKKQLKSQLLKGINPKPKNKEEARYIGSVKGGLNRNKKAAKIGGKFIANETLEKIKEIAEETGVKNVDAFIKQNEIAIQNFINGEPNLISINDTGLMALLSRYTKRNVFIVTDGEKRRVTKIEAIHEVSKVTQVLMTEADASGFETKVKQFNNGEIEIVLPSIELIMETIESGELLAEIETDFIPYTYNSKNVSDAKQRAIEKITENGQGRTVQKNINAIRNEGNRGKQKRKKKK